MHEIQRTYIITDEALSLSKVEAGGEGLTSAGRERGRANTRSRTHTQFNSAAHLIGTYCSAQSVL